MKTRRSMPTFESEEGTVAGIEEIQEEFKPPQARLTQILIVALVVIVTVSALLLKVMSDQRARANQTANTATAAQSTALAQLTALTTELSSLSTTVEAQTAQTFQPDVPFSYEIVPSPSAEERSRNLAYVALSQVQIDPERSILIALVANQVAHTYEADDALRRTLMASHFRMQLRSNEGDIQSAAFSPDGRFLVTTESSGPACIWSLRSGTEVRELEGHTGRVLSAQFSPDGSLIMTTSADETARLWDAQTGSTIAILVGHEAEVTSARFSSDGRHIVTGSRDGTARVWTTDNVTDSMVLTGTQGSVNSVEWSPDDQRIMATGSRGLSVWDARTGKLLFTVKNAPADQAIVHAHFSPHGEHVVMTGSTFPRILDAFTGQTVYTFDRIIADTAHFSPDGRWLLTDGLLWDQKTDQPFFQFPMASPFHEQFSPNGRFVVAPSGLHTLSLWEFQSNDGQPQQVATLKSGSNYKAVEFSPDSQSLISIGTDGTARLWQVDNNDMRFPVNYDRVIAMAKRSVTRQLTCPERQVYLREDVNCKASAP